MIDIKEMYAYSRGVRSKFAMKLSELPSDLVDKNREASFHTMKNILLHMIDNEDWIVNYAIFGKTKAYTRRKWEEYTSIGMVLDHLREVEEKTRNYFGRADNAELGRKVIFELTSGKTFNLTVEECLFQSFTEQLYHLGELIALLWQENIEPPAMQWFYNNPRTEKTV
jgi:uncharacterized damage-inducible protein DinB